jgi:type II restriction/modification system DNA methylase subunit YeeA
LKQLLDLEKEVVGLAGELGVGRFFPGVSPAQLHGIEINAYARELAQATIQIGYIQWLSDNGFGLPGEPILRPLDTILHMDAILAYDEEGRPVEPEWPTVDAIVGNPPFLGGQKLRRQLAKSYVEDLFHLYKGRLSASSDLVCYWFERARERVANEQTVRVGLLATQAIRAGANRRVLHRIKEVGDFFMAWSDREWVLDGADVRVSIICFDGGHERARELNGHPVHSINADLSQGLDLTLAKPLPENKNLCFRCDEKGGPFDITAETARAMLSAPLNPNGRPNIDVVRPYFNAYDVTRRSREVWIIDFGPDASEAEAADYEMPFEYVRRVVKPVRDSSENPRQRAQWWLHRRPAPDMRQAVSRLSRFVATPRVAKHRLFLFLPASTLPDSRVAAIAREDYYFFGVLHSYVHELWSLRKVSHHGVGDDPTYNITTCFETFPFPWLPGREPAGDARVEAIAQAARELVEKRDRWLNPEGASEAEMQRRTLTNLYNQRPTWLELAHRKLDEVVLDAYGWPHDLSDEEILARLLALNLARSGS